MIEALKMLIDLAARAVPALTDKRKKKQLSNIGVDLFLLYIRFNEAMIRGERIVQNLEEYVRLCDEHQSYGPFQETSYLDDLRLRVADDTLAQREDFSAISERLQSWSYKIQVLNGDAYFDLMLHTYAKGSALEVLQRIMSDGFAPTVSFKEALPDKPGKAFGEELMGNQLRTDAIDLNRPWEPTTYHLICRYLAERQPRQQLDEIRKTLGEYRQTLENTFSVADILPKVGDKS